MNTKCGLGFHAWRNCECTACGKHRDKEHAWEDCKCSKCYKARDEHHVWKGCKCARCGKLQNFNHDFRNGCTCATCGAIQDENHEWDGNLQCRVCGEHAPEWMSRLAHCLRTLPTTDIPEGAERSKARHSLKTALNCAAEHVKEGYRELGTSPESFAVERELTLRHKSFSHHYDCQFGKELCLSLRWGFSEKSLTVKKHGDDGYSICFYKYYESEDDGGRHWYL